MSVEEAKMCVEYYDANVATIEARYAEKIKSAEEYRNCHLGFKKAQLEKAKAILNM
jgi:hypothetical protein